MKEAPLSVIGGQGVFVKELENALLAGHIDIGVHSLKDLPTTLPDQLCLAAVTVREDPRDALVLRSNYGVEVPSLSSLAPEAIVGTSSPRRLAQLKHYCPTRVVKDLRGNVDTRLRKLDAGWYDAIIVAAAGLRRLELSDRISAFLDPSEMLPAVGQGALGIETRLDDNESISVVRALNHSATMYACTAERELLRALGGGCQSPIAGHAVVRENHLRLDGLVASRSGDKQMRDTVEGMASDAEQLGNALAEKLLSQGATTLMRRELFGELA